VEPVTVGAHPGEASERAGSLGARRGRGHNLLEQIPRALWIAGLELAVGGLGASAADLA